MKRLIFALALNVFGWSAGLAAELGPAVVPLPPGPAVVPLPPVPAKYAPVSPAYYDWGGFYIGGNLGAGFSGGSFSDSVGNTFSTTKNSSFIGGGQIGVNYEFWGGVLIGAEAMFDWAPNSGISFTATSPKGVTVGTAAINDQWLTTATGKLGYAWDRLLIYGRGGGAWIGSSNSSFNTTARSITLNGPGTTSGWTAGIGTEWAFADRWSVRVEYDYVGLTNQTFTTAPPIDRIHTSNRNIQIVTAGLNYTFGGWW